MAKGECLMLRSERRNGVAGVAETRITPGAFEG
jgi:hypothetical protein